MVITQIGAPGARTGKALHSRSSSARNALTLGPKVHEKEREEREGEGGGVSFNTSVKIPAFTSSPQSFPPGPIQVPLGISPLGVRIAVQRTGLIPHSLLPHMRARTQHIEKDPKSDPVNGLSQTLQSHPQTETHLNAKK